jgi:hypothetical protein
MFYNPVRLLYYDKQKQQGNQKRGQTGRGWLLF